MKTKVLSWLVIASTLLASSIPTRSTASVSNDDLLKVLEDKIVEVTRATVEVERLQGAVNQSRTDVAQAQGSWRKWRWVYGVSAVGLVALSSSYLLVNRVASSAPLGFGLLEDMIELLIPISGYVAAVGVTGYAYLDHRSVKKLEKALADLEGVLGEAKSALDAKKSQLCEAKQRLGARCQ